MPIFHDVYPPGPRDTDVNEPAEAHREDDAEPDDRRPSSQGRAWTGTMLDGPDGRPISRGELIDRIKRGGSPTWATHQQVCYLGLTSKSGKLNVCSAPSTFPDNKLATKYKPSTRIDIFLSFAAPPCRGNRSARTDIAYGRCQSGWARAGASEVCPPCRRLPGRDA